MDLGRMRQRQEMDRLSRVMNPTQINQTPPNVVGPKMAPINPSLDSYRKELLEQGQEKINLAKEREKNRSEQTDRRLSVSERLAALRDMTDSEKMEALQSGRVSLQELRDAESMKRVERQGEIRSDQITQQGDIRTGHIEKQGEIRGRQIEKQGEIGSRYITERGDQARKTKQTPSGTPQTESQKKVALQSKAIGAINRDPSLAEIITFNEQGFPVISPDADPAAQMNAYRVLYGSNRGDINLPLETPPTRVTSTGITQPTAQPVVPSHTTGPLPTNKQGVIQMTDSVTPDKQPESVVMITPDGKGTRVVPKDKIQIALSQGYKHKGQ
jgi:hypothetical protein